MKLFPYQGHHRRATHAVRQIVVREEKVRPHHPARDQVPRPDAVIRRCDLMALILEEGLQQFAYVRIVFNDEDRADVVRMPVPLVARPGGCCVDEEAHLPSGRLSSMEKTDPLPGRDRART